MRIILFIFWAFFSNLLFAEDLADCQTPCCQEYQSMIQACSASENEVNHTADCLKTTQTYQDCKKLHPEIYGPGFE